MDKNNGLSQTCPSFERSKECPQQISDIGQLCNNCSWPVTGDMYVRLQLISRYYSTIILCASWGAYIALSHLGNKNSSIQLPYWFA